MQILQFHTRANEQPHDKPSVYFTAHPDDAEEQLATLERDIFYHENCVIWFDPMEDRQIDDAFLTELSFMKMQLMVIPVTKKLLTEPNRVTQRELAFALAHHIPVLPIIVESLPNPLYKSVFGDMQYLSRVSSDVTALSYEEKLQKFLDAVLVGDEVVVRIKDAFEAKIFLSYRKKDRAIAQELMELIHQNPKLQNVGIWYDEFLVPGEGFNAGIRSALKDSHLCVLTVTPNLVNEKNFIQKYEYRWAREDFQKNVLPAQMEYTERQALCDCFQNFPEVVDARCPDQLQPALISELKDFLGKKSRDPMTTYLLGLAYLHGVNMETNHSRGTEMILQAAREGLLEAKEKLVLMYANGYGVQRDYNASLGWQREVVQDYKALYEQSPNDDTWQKYAWELTYLGDDLVTMCQWDEVTSVFEQAKTLFAEKLQQQENLKYRERFVYILRELSLAYDRLQQTEAAIQTMALALEEAKRIPKDQASLRLQWWHAQILCDLGLFHQKTGHSELALPACEESLEYASELFEKDNNNAAVFLLARIYYYLGQLHDDYNTWDPEQKRYTAEMCYAKSLRLLSILYKGMPTTDETMFLSRCLHTAGQHYERHRQPDEADTFYTKSLTFLNSLLEAWPTEQLAELHEQVLCSQESLKISRNGQQGNLRPQFVKLADNRETADASLQNRRARADAHREWAKACSRGKNHAKALTCFTKAIGLYDKIYQDTQTAQDACDLCAAVMDCVEALRQADQWQGMPSLLSQVKSIAGEALEKQDLPALRRELARSHTYRGRFYLHADSGFEQIALECFLEALPLWEQLAQETNHIDMRLFRAECMADIANCYMYLQDRKYLSLACDYSQQAVEAMEQVYLPNPAGDIALCMKKCYESRGMALFFHDRRKEALPYFTKAYELLPNLTDVYNAVEYPHQRAQMLYFMGELTSGAPGVRHLKEAKAIMEQLLQKHPTKQHTRTLGMILMALKHR